jgi:hypothetical protein
MLVFAITLIVFGMFAHGLTVLKLVQSGVDLSKVQLWHQCIDGKQNDWFPRWELPVGAFGSGGGAI